jgi:hypothetical protein
MGIYYYNYYYGYKGKIIFNGFDETNTYLKVALGLVQVEKFTRITAEVKEMEMQKENE